MTKDELQKMLDAERLAHKAQVDSLRHDLDEERKQADRFVRVFVAGQSANFDERLGTVKLTLETVPFRHPHGRGQFSDSALLDAFAAFATKWNAEACEGSDQKAPKQYNPPAQVILDDVRRRVNEVITEMREDANNNPNGGHYTSYEIHRYADKLCDALERMDAPLPDSGRVVCANYPCRSADCGTNRCNAVFCKGFRSKTIEAEKRRSAK